MSQSDLKTPIATLLNRKNLNNENENHTLLPNLDFGSINVNPFVQTNGINQAQNSEPGSNQAKNVTALMDSDNESVISVNSHDDSDNARSLAKQLQSVRVRARKSTPKMVSNCYAGILANSKKTRTFKSNNLDDDDDFSDIEKQLREEGREFCEAADRRRDDNELAINMNAFANVI